MVGKGRTSHLRADTRLVNMQSTTLASSLCWILALHTHQMHLELGRMIDTTASVLMGVTESEGRFWQCEFDSVTKNC